MAKPLSDRIAETKARRDKAAARLAALEAKAKQVDRKRDTRRKIVVGAAVITEMEHTPMFAKFVREMLGKRVTRPQDVEAIADLVKVPPQAPAANAPGAPTVAREQQAG